MYVIQAEDGHVKIGIAIDPQTRLLALRTGTPFPLRLADVETIDATIRASAVERAAHGLPSALNAHTNNHGDMGRAEARGELS